MPVDDTSDAMIRSEEEHRFERTWRPTRLVRVQKSIVTEERTVTVPVRREEISIETVPLDGASRSEGTRAPRGHPEEGYIFTLFEEEIVVSTRLVPRERVRLVVEREEFLYQYVDKLGREEVVIEGVDRGST